MKPIQVFVCFVAAMALLAPEGLRADQVTLNVIAEAEVRQTITTDIDEAAQGYVEAKASTSGSASNGRRKTYFLFDLAGQSPNTNSPATFTVTLGNAAAPVASGQQRVRLWGLNEAYTGFSAALVWDTAQANTTTDLMATNGTYTASAITDTNIVVPSVSSGSESPYSFTLLPPWGKFIQDSKIVLVLAGVPDTAYNGLSPARMRTNAATLTFTSTAGNQPPAISSIGPQSLAQGATTAQIPFTVVDDADPPDWLTVWATSSSEDIVPSFLIEFSPPPYGTNRWLKVTGSQVGTATVTLHVQDSLLAENQTSFTATVLPDPMISPVPHTNTLVNTATAPLALTVSSANTNASTLVVTGFSSNLTLVPETGLAFGGSGSNRTVIVTPASGQTGVAPITLWVANGALSNSTSFGVIVLPSTGFVFCERFDYPDGNLNPLSADFWSVRTTGNTKVAVANQQAVIQSSGNTWESLLAPLARGPLLSDSHPILYTSLKATWTAMPRDSTGAFVHLADGAGNLLAKIHVLTNGVPDGFFRIGLASGPGNTYQDFPRDLTTNVTYSLVTRYEPESGDGALWIDAPSEADPNAVHAIDVPVASVVSIGLRNRDGLGTIAVDDLQVRIVTRPLAVAMTPPASGIADVDFAAGPDDGATDFVLESATDVAGPYADAGATITALGGARFRAHLTGVTGNQHFYRVKRQPLAFP